MKFISWNVNGLRACVGKDFENQFKALDADFFCLQETKMREGQLDLKFEGYESYWNYAEKKGYSGTAIYTKHKPLSVSYGMGVEEHDHEGRIITLEYDQFYLVTCYTPNSQTELKRLDYRMTWEDDFRKFLKNLDAKKPVVVCGDLNKTLEGTEQEFWIQDCSAATENLLLMANALDLGAVWTALYPLEERYRGMQELLALPGNLIPLNTIVIGYPKKKTAAKDKCDEANISLNGYNHQPKSFL